jgi:hypothetical protein
MAVKPKHGSAMRDELTRRDHPKTGLLSNTPQSPQLQDVQSFSCEEEAVPFSRQDSRYQEV